MSASCDFAFGVGLAVRFARADEGVGASSAMGSAVVANLCHGVPMCRRELLRALLALLGLRSFAALQRPHGPHRFLPLRRLHEKCYLSVSSRSCHFSTRDIFIGPATMISGQRVSIDSWLRGPAGPAHRLTRCYRSPSCHRHRRCQSAGRCSRPPTGQARTQRRSARAPRGEPRWRRRR